MEFIMSTISNLVADFKAAGNDVPEFKNAANLSTACQWGKVATVALGVAALVGAIFSGPIGMFMFGLTALALHDCYKMLDNVQTLADTNGIGRTLGGVASAAMAQKSYDKVVRGTIFARPIANLIK